MAQRLTNAVKIESFIQGLYLLCVNLCLGSVLSSDPFFIDAIHNPILYPMLVSYD